MYTAVTLEGGPHEHWDWPTPSHYSRAPLRQEVGSWPVAAPREQPYLMPYLVSHGNSFITTIVLMFRALYLNVCGVITILFFVQMDKITVQSDAALRLPTQIISPKVYFYCK